MRETAYLARGVRGKVHIQRTGKRAVCGFQDASARVVFLPYSPPRLCKRCLSLSSDEEGR